MITLILVYISCITNVNIIECLGGFGSMYAFEWLDNATTNETTKEIFRQSASLVRFHSHLQYCNSNTLAWLSRLSLSFWDPDEKTLPTSQVEARSLAQGQHHCQKCPARAVLPHHPGMKANSANKQTQRRGSQKNKSKFQQDCLVKCSDLPPLCLPTIAHVLSPSLSLSTAISTCLIPWFSDFGISPQGRRLQANLAKTGVHRKQGELEIMLYSLDMGWYGYHVVFIIFIIICSNDSLYFVIMVMVSRLPWQALFCNSLETGGIEKVTAWVCYSFLQDDCSCAVWASCTGRRWQQGFVSSCHAKGAKACKSQKSEWTCVGLE